MAIVKLYMGGIDKNDDGSEAEYVEVDDSEKYALYFMGWKESENSTLPDNIE